MPPAELQPPGRYNRRGQPTWYASSSAEGAWAEHYKHWDAPDVQAAEVRRRFGDVMVRVRVLDLTDAATRDALGVVEEDLRRDSPEQIARCQDVASWAREHGYDAVLAPSAAYERALTLAVFDEAALTRAEVREDSIVAPPPDPRS